MQNDSAEHWLPIAGYEGFYEVSTLGRVRSLDRMSRMRNGSVRRHTGRTLKLKRNPQTGYLFCTLSRDGKPSSRTVHRLVAETFLEHDDQQTDLEVCHNDGDPLNVRLTNLRWDTRSGNHRDKRRHGTAGNPYQASKTHCPQGHAYTPENTATKKARGYSYRVCRRCLMDYRRR